MNNSSENCKNCKYFNNEICLYGDAYRLICIHMSENCPNKEEIKHESSMH